MSATRRIGAYDVVRELGRGGMGVVYEVRDPATPDRRLALKLILGATDREALARFGREVELLARVRHRSVVPVHSIARAPEGPYVVMDLVEGESLSARAARGVSPLEAATLMRDLCDAVAALHAVGIVHRDLKPANVIVRPDGSPVLLDFGVARAATGASLTRTGEIIGSPRYMSPEQAQGKGAAPIDARSDVYGLGAILFELLAGEPPFADVDGSPFKVLLAVMERGPTWPAGRRVPAALQTICRRAMAKDPAERFQSAGDLRAALEQALAAGSRARGSLALLVTGALALMVLAAVAAFALRRPRPPGPTSSTATVASAVAPPRLEPVGSEPAAAVTSTAPPAFARRWTLTHTPGDARGVWSGADRVATTGGAELRLWDLSGPEPRLLTTTPTGYPVGRAVVARDRLLVSSEGLQAFTLDDLVAIPGQHDVHYEGQRRIDGLAVSPDGRSVAYGYDGGIGVVHVGSAERLGELYGALECSTRIRAVAYSPAGDRLFCTSATRDPRSLSAWELRPDGVPSSPRRDHPLMNAGAAIAVSPDGEDVVVGTARGTIVRMGADGSEPRVLSDDGFGGIGVPSPTSGRVNAQDVAFTADGALLFTLVGDDDESTLEVWARRGWRRLVTGLSIPRRARQLAPSPDGRRLLVGTPGGVEVWDVPEALREGAPR